jgi:hypothetical protein
MQDMVEDAFQQCDEPPLPVPTFEEQLESVLMDIWTIADELADVGVDDEPLGDNGGNTHEVENHDDPHVLGEAMEELYHGARSAVLATIILIMTMYTIHGVSNKFADQLFTLFRQHLIPNENQLSKN